jgi:hypothetical protein
LFPRQGVQGAHRLQGLDHLTYPLVKGGDRLLIGGLQVLLNDRRGVGFDGLCQAAQAGPHVLHVGMLVKTEYW